MTVDTLLTPMHPELGDDEKWTTLLHV